MERTDAVREEALKILMKVFDDKSYSNILIKNLGQKFSALDRAFITEIVYGTIKYKLRIDYIIESLSNIKLNKLSPYVLNILRLGIYQIDFMDKVPQSAAVNECVKLVKKYSNIGSVKYVNGLLRSYCRNHDINIFPNRKSDIVHYLSVFYSFPEWIVTRIIKDFGESFTEEFLNSSNDIPYLTVRINKLKIDKNSLKRSLTDKGIEVKDGLYIDDSLMLKGVSGIENLEEYNKGYLTVQDESSMIAVRVLSPEPGELIMDVCSAPGTKSTYAAELMNNKGKIISGDISDSKLGLVKENCQRLGIEIIDVLKNDAVKIMNSYVGKADKVIIDAPCSGLGIMRKKPEIRWNRNSDDIKQITSIQSAILDASKNYVKPGGILVYSTCTVLKEENTEMVNGFTKNNRDFVLDDITDLVPDKLKKQSVKNGYIELYPSSDGIDGFFIARLRRME